MMRRATWLLLAMGAVLLAPRAHAQESSATLFAEGQRLMAQGKYFQQEVWTRRQSESDRSEGPNDVLHRA